jgi:hypothetical protein
MVTPYVEDYLATATRALGAFPRPENLFVMTYTDSVTRQSPWRPLPPYGHT